MKTEETIALHAYLIVHSKISPSQDEFIHFPDFISSIFNLFIFKFVLYRNMQIIYYKLSIIMNTKNEDEWSSILSTDGTKFPKRKEYNIISVVTIPI